MSRDHQLCNWLKTVFKIKPSATTRQPEVLKKSCNSFTINGVTIETPNGMPVTIGGDKDGNLYVNGVRVKK